MPSWHLKAFMTKRPPSTLGGRVTFFDKKGENAKEKKGGSMIETSEKIIDFLFTLLAGLILLLLALLLKAG